MAPHPPADPDLSAPVFSVDDESAYRRHFDEFGFVVVGGVLDEECVTATVAELWDSPSLLGGHPGICRDDPSSWDSDLWPAGSRNFLDSLDPCAEVQSWQNRVNPAIARIYEVLWQGRGVPPQVANQRSQQEQDQREDHQEPHVDGEGGGRLVVSVDRFGVMRPTKLPGAKGERPEWRTSRNWLHWDQNPWSNPGFFAMQGLVALSPADPSAGGFATVPGFHKEFEDWSRAHPEGSIKRVTSTTVPFPVPLDDEMQNRRVKVLVPLGGLLVWDSRMPHENWPNEGCGWRLVQYITCKRLSPAGLERRAAAWRAGLRTGLVPVGFARRFSASEHALLGMASSWAPPGAAAEEAAETETRSTPLEEALGEGARLSEDCLEAARKLRRAYRLKQTAIEPGQLKEAADLFKAAFATNPALREPLQRVAAAEDSYLPFWIL